MNNEMQMKDQYIDKEQADNRQIGAQQLADQQLTDERWMAYALCLSQNGLGYTNPNPMVGAVIVKDGQIIGEGWHRYCGGLHGERNAFRDCLERGNDAEGATIYVTLEPCCHYGKTPPCTEAIIENRLARVVYGALDPNPKVAGQGLKILEAAGIRVDGPVLNQECLDINRVFFHYITKDTPYVISKYAMTADGRIASFTGDSKWVTGDQARRYTHLTRRHLMAIMVGVGTVIADNPMLNCRLDVDSVDDYGLLPDRVRSLAEAAGNLDKERLTALQKSDLKAAGGGSADPVRVVLDTHLRIPLESDLVKTAHDIRTIVAYVDDKGAEGQESSSGSGLQSGKLAKLEKAGVELIRVRADKNGHADIAEVARVLHFMKIDSILIEGGGELHFSALEAGIVNEVHAYIAPKIIGGATAKGPVGGPGIEKMAAALPLGRPEVRMLGDDILLSFRLG